jgi:glucokinase
MAGCLERLAAGPAIARAAGMPSEEVVKAARQGDPEATDVLGKVVDYLAMGFINIVRILDPDLVVIGGGLSQVEDVIVDPLKRRIKEIYRSSFADELKIRTAMFGDDAGIIGAAAQFNQEYIDLG